MKVTIGSSLVLATAVAASLAAQTSELRPKSPSRAVGLSIAGTALPIAAGIGLMLSRPGCGAGGCPNTEPTEVAAGVLIGIGAGLGPSAGHFYAGRIGWLLPRLLVGGAFGLIALGTGELERGAAIAAAGAVAVTVTAIRDIVMAPGAARAYNANRGLHVVIKPLPTAGSLRLGLGLAAPLR